jgi:hypothetical protein
VLGVVALSPPQRRIAARQCPAAARNRRSPWRAPFTAVRALFSACLSTVHARSPCSQMFRARAARTRARWQAPPHRPTPAAERAATAAADPCQPPRCVAHTESFLPGQTSSKTEPGRPRSANAGEAPPRKPESGGPAPPPRSRWTPAARSVADDQDQIAGG